MPLVFFLIEYLFYPTLRYDEKTRKNQTSTINFKFKTWVKISFVAEVTNSRLKNSDWQLVFLIFKENKFIAN